MKTDDDGNGKGCIKAYDDDDDDDDGSDDENDIKEVTEIVGYPKVFPPSSPTDYHNIQRHRKCSIGSKL